MLQRNDRRVGIVYKAIFILPLVLLQVQCAEVPRSGKPSKAVADRAPEDPAKVELERQVRAAAAEGIVAAGAAAYRAGDLDKARFFFARATPHLKPRLYAVNDALAFLPLGRHPLLVPTVAKDFGKLSAGERGTWVDVEAGYGVLDRGLAERIAADYLPGPMEKSVFIHSAIIRIQADAAREWSKRLTSDARPRDWMHPWIPVNSYFREMPEHVRSRLDWHVSDFVRTAKAGSHTEVVATPFVLSDDRRESLISISETRFVAGEDPEPGQEISPGLFFWVWPRIQDDEIRLLLKGSIREHWAERQTIVETARWEFDLTVPDGGEAIVLGRAPTDDEVAKGVSVTWLCVQANVVGVPLARISHQAPAATFTACALVGFHAHTRAGRPRWLATRR